MTYTTNTKGTSAENQSNYGNKWGGSITWSVQCVMSLAKDYSCIVTISGIQKTRISIVVPPLHLSTSFGRPEISYTNCTLFTKSESTKYRKIIQCFILGFS
jgi:hypothetical protein